VNFKYYDVDKGNLIVTCHFLKEFHSRGVRCVLIESARLLTGWVCVHIFPVNLCASFMRSFLVFVLNSG
jgi:hypothetical protein